MHVKRESNQCFAIEHTLVLLLQQSARILASVVVARLILLSCLLKRHPSYKAENGVAYSRLKTLIPQPC